MSMDQELSLSIADCKNILYYLEPHEKTCGITGYKPEPYESLEKSCNYCRNRIAVNEAANIDGFMNNEYNELE